MDTYRIIERLEYIQQHDGRTSRAMAKAIGVAPSTYCRWMEHSAEPDVKSIRLIAAFEKRRTDDLLGVKDDQVLPQVPKTLDGPAEGWDGSSMSQLVPGLRAGEPDPHGSEGSGEDRRDDPGRPETAGDEGGRSDAEKALTVEQFVAARNAGLQLASEYLGRLNGPKDNVNHPGHYTRGRFEVIDVIESIVESMYLTPVEAALTAQVVKYIARWKNKNGAEDLKKAQWYLERLIGKVDVEQEEAE